MANYTLGDILRDKRLELGMSLSEAAELTNIRARVLEDFESGDFSRFPAKGYTQGMLSSYAKVLGLDSRKLLSVYESELTAFEEYREIAKNAEYARRGGGKFGVRRPAGAKPVTRNTGSSKRTADERVQAREALLDAADAGRETARSGSVRIVGTRAGLSGSWRMPSAAGGRSTSRDDGTGREPAAGREQARTRRNAGRTEANGAPDTPATSASAPHRSTDASGDMDAAAGAASLSPSEEGTAFSPAPKTRRRHSAFEEYKRQMRERERAEQEGRAAAAEQTAQAGKDGLSNALEATDEEISTEQDCARRRRNRQRREQAERELRSTLTRQQNFFQMLGGIVASIFAERRTRLIAIAVIMLVVAVAIVAAFLITTAGSGSAGVIAVQGAAQDETVTTPGEVGASATVTTTNGNPVSISISVAEGQTSLINVTYDDDKAYSGTAIGAWNRTFQVTESMEARFGNPDAVQVTENGQDVQIERLEDGTGRLSLVIQTANAAQTGSR